MACSATFTTYHKDRSENGMGMCPENKMNKYKRTNTHITCVGHHSRFTYYVPGHAWVPKPAVRTRTRRRTKGSRCYETLLNNKMPQRSTGNGLLKFGLIPRRRDCAGGSCCRFRRRRHFWTEIVGTRYY